MQANDHEYNADIVKKFLPTQKDTRVLIALPAYSKYFQEKLFQTLPITAKNFQHCEVNNTVIQNGIQCYCNSQLCNGMDKSDLIQFLNTALPLNKVDWLTLAVCILKAMIVSFLNKHNYHVCFC